jgi:ornithine carbamoyltransferase
LTRHLLSIGDLTSEELAEILDRSEGPPAARALSGKGVALVFEHPSARTRNACELAVVQLGGHPVAIAGHEIGLDKRERAEDVARTLACYHHLIGARVGRHTLLERMAAALDAARVGVPVVNLLSDREHPTQALADVLTLRQTFGSLQGRSIAYVGDANNVCRSLAGATALCGMQLRVASPAGYSLADSDAAWVKRLGGEVVTFDAPQEAVRGADAIYTDVWVSMGQDEEAWARRRAFAGFTVDERLIAMAAPRVVVLHCLPAHRGEEISAAAIDGPYSAVWQQAANRMHVMRGLLTFLLERSASKASAA